MNLSPDQEKVVASARSGRNLLVTGPGGTGKSFLLKYLIEDLEVRSIRFGVCGSTGVAAVMLGGTTLHSWAGIGLGDGLPSSLANNIRNNPAAFDRVKRSKVLIVDEVSMIAAELLTKLDKVFKIIRESELPFGGMQMIFVGDFLQLKPVEGKYAFESPAWTAAEIKVHVLTHVFRQEDQAFAAALGNLRKGNLDQATKDLFNSRSRIPDPNPEILAVAITAKNVTADAINNRHLTALPGPSKTFHAIDNGSPSAMKLLEKGTIPKELILKIGARVMCLVNFSPEDGVMNGSVGTVTGWSYAGFPIVDFDCGAALSMEPYVREITLDGAVIGSRKQVPLRLSWACSAHKIQGQSLDKIEAHLGEAFTPGQIYVALSRVRTLEGLRIISINKESLSADPTALKFYDDAAAADVDEML